MKDSGDRSGSPEYEKPTYHNWAPLARRYHPLQTGSIDGTDNLPHDNAVWRAMHAKYKPNKQVTGVPDCTLFVGQLSRETKQDTLEKFFSKFGDLEKCRLIRDFVTGFSRGYAFIEYKDRWDAKLAYREMHKQMIDGHEILIEHEAACNLKGWVPRRLGGGFGGKKESGQLRFGGRDRPFRRPLPVKTLGSHSSGQSEIPSGRDSQRAGDRDEHHRQRDRVTFRDRARDPPERDRDGRGHGERDQDILERDRDGRGRDNRDRDIRERDRDGRGRDERDREIRERDRDGRGRDKRDRDRDRDIRGRDDRVRDGDERDRSRDRDSRRNREHKRDRDREKSSSRRHGDKSRDQRDRKKGDSRKYENEKEPRRRSRSQSKEQGDT